MQTKSNENFIDLFSLIRKQRVFEIKWFKLVKVIVSIQIILKVFDIEIDLQKIRQRIMRLPELLAKI